MKLRVVPSALSLILSEGIPGLIAVTPAPAAAAKSAYAVTDLGNLGGGVSLGFGINASGEVVGRSYLDKVFVFKCGKHTCRFTQNDPFSWTASTMTDLGTFSATAMSEATAVNRDQRQRPDRRQRLQRPGQEHAFLLTQLMSAPRIYRPPA
jgi:hypothetical protein